MVESPRSMQGHGKTWSSEDEKVSINRVWIKDLTSDPSSMGLVTACHWRKYHSRTREMNLLVPIMLFQDRHNHCESLGMWVCSHHASSMFFSKLGFPQMCPSCLCSCPSRQSTAQKPSTWKAVPMILAWTHFSLAPHCSNDGWSSHRSTHTWEHVAGSSDQLCTWQKFFSQPYLQEGTKGGYHLSFTFPIDICLCVGSCPPQVSIGKLSLLAGSSSVTALLTQPIGLIYGSQNTSCCANEAFMPLWFLRILLFMLSIMSPSSLLQSLSKAASSSYKLLLPLP